MKTPPQYTFCVCIITLFTCILSSSAYAQIQKRGDNRSFSVVGVAGARTHYPVFVLEGSLGNASLTAGIGGGYMGWDRQEVRYGEKDFEKKYVRVMNSKTLVDMPNSLGEGTYLSATRTQYYGVTARAGIRYYFHKQIYQSRMEGLYVGADLYGAQIFEIQEITYRQKVGTQSWIHSGRNKTYVFGTNLRAGYNWYPANSTNFHLNFAVARPFYIPFQEEVNLTSPFTASSWEFEVGFGFRIKAR